LGLPSRSLDVTKIGDRTGLPRSHQDCGAGGLNLRLGQC
jgi:hypothetical protein